MNNKQLSIKQALNFFAFLAMVTVNALANILPINGKNTGELSDLYPNLFVPAGLTFSIWGIIYTLLLIFCIYQALDIFKQNKQSRNFLEKISYFFIISCLLNISWILAWHYEKLALSVVIMLLLFLSIIAIYLRLDIGIKASSIKEKYLVQLPFSIYTGWLTIAIIANITSLLVKINWNRFGFTEITWTVILLLIGTIITLLILLKRNDIFYSLVVVWAFAGIIIKRYTLDTNYTKAIIITAAICIILILIGILARFKKYLWY